MARLILTSPGEDVDVGGDVEVIGTTSGGEVITLLRGDIHLDPSFNAGGDTIVLPQAAGSYTARLVGSQVLIESGSLSVLIPVGTGGSEIQFADASLELVIDTASGTVRLGEQVVTATAQDVDPNASAGTGTPQIAETSGSNDTFGSAQHIDRDDLRVADNPLLDDESLPSATISGSLSDVSDNDFYEIELQEGEQLLLDIDDAAEGLDTFLRVFGPDGQEITFGDDSPLDSGSDLHPNRLGFTLDSAVTFRAPSAGTYTFSVESYRDEDVSGSSGDYQVHVSIGDPVALSEIVAEDIANLLSGQRWFDNDLTYGFPTLASQYGSDGTKETANGFEAFNPTQQLAVAQILSQIASITDLNFTQATTNPGTADLRYAMSDEPETAYARYPGSGGGGDSWYNNESGTYDAPSPGNYAWATLIHETGHALGLKHGHEAPAVSLFFDSVEYTIMSYRSYPGASATGDDAGYRNETWGFPTTLMMYDIAALQNLYEPDFSYNSSDTVYSWSQASGDFSVNGRVEIAPGDNRVFMTVWDGGGEDTYDLSRYDSDLEIDLRPGEWSLTSEVQLANLGERHYAVGNIANALLFEGDERSLIENGIGGAGDDRFIANQVANTFTGGAGDDTFLWYSADDSDIGEADRILDFTRGRDHVDLSNIDADSRRAGDQDFDFIGSAAFTDTAGELRYEVDGEVLRLQGDVNGDGAADFEVLLANLTAIGSADVFA